MLRNTLATLLIALLTAPLLAADPQPTAKSAAPAGKPKAAKQEHKITVVSVKGIVQKRLATDPKVVWTKVNKGEELTKLTIISTGLGSRVEIKFSNRANVVVKNGTQVGIGEFLDTKAPNGLIKTRLGMKYGAMNIAVDSSTGANDFRVRTAVATASVKGTKGLIAMWGDFGLKLKGTEGTWRMASGSRGRNVRKGQWGDDKLTPADEIAQQQRDIETGDPFGLTDEESRNLRKYGTGRGIIGFTGTTVGDFLIDPVNCSGSNPPVIVIGPGQDEIFPGNSEVIGGGEVTSETDMPTPGRR